MKNSLYAQFLKEYAGREIIEDEDSFVTYGIFKAGNISSLKIMDMFVKKEARGKDKSYKLLDILVDVAKKEGCSLISAQIEKAADEFVQQRSMHICRMFGMEKTYEDGNYTIYSRSVK
jgi:GNAT superfamily N-acetyltransferase